MLTWRMLDEKDERITPKEYLEEADCEIFSLKNLNEKGERIMIVEEMRNLLKEVYEVEWLKKVVVMLFGEVEKVSGHVGSSAEEFLKVLVVVFSCGRKSWWPSV